MIRWAIRHSLFASALCAGGFLALATTARETVTGSGVPATEEREIGNVSEVVLSGAGDLTIVSGPAPALRVTADNNVLPLLETESSNGKLTLQPRSRTSLHAKTKIAYTLTVPHLDAITVSGAGTVKTERLEADDLKVKLSGAGKAQLENVTCRSLSLNMSGAGNAVVSGTAEKLTLRISGAGNAEAVKFKVKSADVKISGAGHATLWATDDLKARVSGAGSVKYRGQPQIDQKASGAAKIRPVE